jgi:hypothetical protein
MPLASVLTLAREAKVPEPKFRVQKEYENASKNGKKGYRAVLKKYGTLPRNERLRSAAWRAWWEREGKKKEHLLLQARPIRKPPRDIELAEFIGIMMGDGTIAKYQVAITLNRTEDRVYAHFVAKRITHLFAVSPSLYDKPKNGVVDIVVSRIKLVRYLQELGLPRGNKIKQELDMPWWIKNDARLARACVRGLVDTDGCVFRHTYLSKGRRYAYTKLSFTSYSRNLRVSVADVLYKNGMRPRITGKDVRLDRAQDVSRYFKIFGSSNPKHLKRYRDSRTID